MKVRLLKAHTHAGVDYRPGDELDIGEADARWLQENEVARPSRPAKSAPREGEKETP